MADTVIYVHGRGGSAAEAELYRPLFPACEVIGFDYRAQTPWEAKDEFPALFAPFYEKSGRVFLIANSIGAFFSLHALDAERIEKAFLISPVADMAALVAGMMARAGVTEDALYEKRTVVTADGETLSWEYLEYVRAHPLEWRAPTEILYGERDALTSLETMRAFAGRIGARLTVMPNGEHWFHTPEQMRFLREWLLRVKGS